MLINVSVERKFVGEKEGLDGSAQGLGQAPVDDQWENHRGGTRIESTGQSPSNIYEKFGTGRNFKNKLIRHHVAGLRLVQ